MEKHVLSKSTYMLGCQCTKRLYLHKFKSDLRNLVDENQQAIFDAGTRVGEIARQLFPKGTDASPVNKFNYQESVLKTQELIANGIKVIYEACFQFDGVLCAIDILVNKKGKWYAYEVKGSTEVKNYHIEDAALQYYVITNSGLKLEDISIVYLNNKYVRQGDLDIQQLFSTESVLDRIIIKQEAVVKKIKELKKIITEKKEPVIKVGMHCSDPFDCDFINHCWKDIPTENSVMLLHKKDKMYFLENEIYSFEEIPEYYKLDKRSSKKIAKLNDTEITINKEQIGNFLAKIASPYYYFDFETYQMAVPEFDQLRPYQMVPFQYSVHIKENENSIVNHTDFLGDGINDPRITLIEKMLADLGKKGSIICYNAAFEKTRIKDLAMDFPEYSASLNKLITRIVDLMVPFQKLWYYHPKFKAKHSIKYVLPALIPELTYSDLEIQNGGEASAVYPALINKTEEEKTSIRNNLLEYCKLDTLAMVKIHEHLVEICK